jgi:hypothetical protein
MNINSIRWIRWLLPALLAGMLQVAVAHADYITYTESTMASGMLGSSSFTDALVTLTVVGNPLAPTLCAGGGVPNCTADAGQISVDVAGVGTANFLAANNNGAQGVVLGTGTGSGTMPSVSMSVFKFPNGSSGAAVLVTSSSAFATYDITQSIGPITGSSLASNNFPFPTSAGDLVLNSVGDDATFSAVSTLTLPGGTLSNPVTFLEQGLGQISSSIGAFGSESAYEFSWSGGEFSATAAVSDANPDDSYEYILSQLYEPGQQNDNIDSLILNSMNNFTDDISETNLPPGDYVIGLFANNVNDPNFTINFNTPVNGTAGASVPEPSSLALFAPALVLLLLFVSLHRGNALDTAGRLVVRSFSQVRSLLGHGGLPLSVRL